MRELANGETDGVDDQTVYPLSDTTQYRTKKFKCFRESTIEWNNGSA